ncbi:MAG: AAA family ATPase, partial [Eubacteriaceae bacterium]|nr:AAA family ATPase [Eubacteriaceae bacterium]
ESIFSGVNNISVYTALDEEYSAYFGFTEEEVAAMLSYYSLEGRMADMKEYYDGYRMGAYEMFNPWSVVKQCSRMLVSQNAEPEKFWAYTATNDLAREMLMSDGLEALSSIENLISGGAIEKSISILAAYRGLIDTHSSDAVWEMLFMAGYLTWVRKTADGMYELRAPNLEVRGALRKDALSWAKSAMPIRRGKADALYKSFLERNAQEAEAIINDLLENVFSVRDGIAVHGDFVIKNERDCHLIATAFFYAAIGKFQASQSLATGMWTL